MKPKILIVEDDMMMRTIFELYVQQSGLELVGLASSGKDALALCKDKNPDLVLIDIHLEEEMDGLELSEKITEEFDLPYIFISADPDPDLIFNSVSENAYGFLQKPLYKNNLKSTILFAIAKHNMKRQKQN
ncbi:MAG: response regulator [Bacteroidales bacterium]|nr:response regulator [Bacteroidales bacterium]